MLGLVQLLMDSGEQNRICLFVRCQLAGLWAINHNEAVSRILTRPIFPSWPIRQNFPEPPPWEATCARTVFLLNYLEEDSYSSSYQWLGFSCSRPTALQNLGYYFEHLPLNKAFSIYISKCKKKKKIYRGFEKGFPHCHFGLYRTLRFGWFSSRCRSRSFPMPLYNFLSWVHVCVGGWFCFVFKWCLMSG